MRVESIGQYAQQLQQLKLSAEQVVKQDRARSPTAAEPRLSKQPAQQSDSSAAAPTDLAREVWRVAESHLQGETTKAEFAQFLADRQSSLEAFAADLATDTQNYWKRFQHDVDALQEQYVEDATNLEKWQAEFRTDANNLTAARAVAEEDSAQIGSFIEQYGAENDENAARRSMFGEDNANFVTFQDQVGEHQGNLKAFQANFAQDSNNIAAYQANFVDDSRNVADAQADFVQDRNNLGAFDRNFQADKNENRALVGNFAEDRSSFGGFQQNYTDDTATLSRFGQQYASELTEHSRFREAHDTLVDEINRLQALADSQRDGLQRQTNLATSADTGEQQDQQELDKDTVQVSTSGREELTSQHSFTTPGEDWLKAAPAADFHDGGDEQSLGALPQQLDTRRESNPQQGNNPLHGTTVNEAPSAENRGSRENEFTLTSRHTMLPQKSSGPGNSRISPAKQQPIDQGSANDVFLLAGLAVSNANDRSDSRQLLNDDLIATFAAGAGGGGSAESLITGQDDQHPQSRERHEASDVMPEDQPAG